MVVWQEERALNTPYGLLLNELARSPTQTVNATITLLKCVPAPALSLTHILVVPRG